MPAAAIIWPTAWDITAILTDVQDRLSLHCKSTVVQGRWEAWLVVEISTCVSKNQHQTWVKYTHLLGCSPISWTVTNKPTLDTLPFKPLPDVPRLLRHPVETYSTTCHWNSPWVFDVKSCCEIEKTAISGPSHHCWRCLFPIEPRIATQDCHPELKNFSSPNSKPTYLSPNLPVELLKRILRHQILGFYSTVKQQKSCSKHYE